MLNDTSVLRLSTFEIHRREPALRKIWREQAPVRVRCSDELDPGLPPGEVLPRGDGAYAHPFLVFEPGIDDRKISNKRRNTSGKVHDANCLPPVRNFRDWLAELLSNRNDPGPTGHAFVRFASGENNVELLSYGEIGVRETNE